MVERMDAQKFIYRLDQFRPAFKDDFEDFKKILEDYPFFQPAMIYLLKASPHHSPDHFDFLLQQAASMTYDRSLLYQWIKNPIQRKKAKVEDPELEIKKQVLDKTSPETPKENSTPEEMNFLDWIRFIDKQKKNAQEKSMSIDKKIELFDSFLPKSSRMDTRPKEDKMVDLSSESWASSSELMTETLAKVFIKQKKYGKAIKAYEILCLKYPEKNGFFVNQIKEIKKIKQQK